MIWNFESFISYLIYSYSLYCLLISLLQKKTKFKILLCVLISEIYNWLQLIWKYFYLSLSHWMIVNFLKSIHRNKKLKSVFVSYSFVSCPATNRRAGNCPIRVAFSSSTWRIEPSRRAKTGGTPGTSWYWRILSSRVSPLWVELGS